MQAGVSSNLPDPLIHADLTKEIIGAAMDVHAALGPGLLVSAYEACLAHELTLRQLPFVRQAEVQIPYKGTTVDCGFRLDLLVGGEVVLELKAVERLLPIHTAQLLTYLRLSGKRVGLLINFNVESLRDGIVWRVLSSDSKQMPFNVFNSVKLRATPW